MNLCYLNVLPFICISCQLVPTACPKPSPYLNLLLPFDILIYVNIMKVEVFPVNVGKKTVVAFLVSSLTVTGAALSSFSAPFVFKSGSAASSIDSLTSDAVSSAEMVLANEIGKALGISVPLHDISSMQHHNLGYGEIALAYNLAHASGRSVDEILTMRLNQKMGWGKIAKTLGVKLHSAADRSVHILKQSKLDNEVDHFNHSIKDDLGSCCRSGRQTPL